MEYHVAIITKNISERQHFFHVNMFMWMVAGKNIQQYSFLFMTLQTCVTTPKRFCKTLSSNIFAIPMLKNVGNDVIVGQHDALWAARSARWINDHCYVACGIYRHTLKTGALLPQEIVVSCMISCRWANHKHFLLNTQTDNWQSTDNAYIMNNSLLEPISYKKIEMLKLIISSCNYYCKDM